MRAAWSHARLHVDGRGVVRIILAELRQGVARRVGVRAGVVLVHVEGGPRHVRIFQRAQVTPAVLLGLLRRHHLAALRELEFPIPLGRAVQALGCLGARIRGGQRGEHAFDLIQQRKLVIKGAFLSPGATHRGLGDGPFIHRCTVAPIVVRAPAVPRHCLLAREGIHAVLAQVAFLGGVGEGFQLPAAVQLLRLGLGRGVLAQGLCSQELFQLPVPVIELGDQIPLSVRVAEVH
mmetsp:Transcript_11787/g.27799  ORF Transcript_11787/g.27799 Transcript_11787/m.27799 type:complete len:234 (-) Transcript_11787:794-1495(-)